jgi:hypothetical protein
MFLCFSKIFAEIKNVSLIKCEIFKCRFLNVVGSQPEEGNLTNIIQVRRNVNIMNNCLVCGEVMSLINS